VETILDQGLLWEQVEETMSDDKKEECEHVYSYCTAIDGNWIEEFPTPEQINPDYCDIEKFNYCPRCGVKLDHEKKV